MAKFVSHTNGTTDVGGGNNTMARGKSVVSNPIGDAAGSPNRGTSRGSDPKYAGQTGDRGQGVFLAAPLRSSTAPLVRLARRFFQRCW